MKKVLSIAGSDCSGGAGIQADLKTFSAHGVFGMSVIVSVVAENTSRVIDIQDITPDMIEKQIDAVFEDIEVDAVKIGMLSTPECMKTSVYKGYKQDKIEMRGDRAEMSDFPLYLNTVAGGLDRRDQTIGGFSFVVKIYAVPVVEIIG